MKRLNVDDKTTKNFNILAISMNYIYNHFDGLNNIIYRSVSS